MKRAIVVGSGGQDGSILFDRLAREGAFVLGIERTAIRSTHPLSLNAINILRTQDVALAMEAVQPDEVYYLAAHHHSSEANLSHEKKLFEKSVAVNVSGLLHFLEALRRSPRTRLFYAASSRVFARSGAEFVDEQTPMVPECIYGASKAAGVECCRFYRERYGLFAATGILFNHESALRRAEFVSQRIAHGAVAIRSGRMSQLTLGSLVTRIDWGYAPDYVDAMVRILGNETADDFIIASGVAHSVADFARLAFAHVGLDWRLYVQENSELVGRQRQALAGNPAKLRAQTGWKPTVNFEQMIELLVDAAQNDLQRRTSEEPIGQR